jgi:CelD/BcsL family acetyltransferase involved in cellulose biosynthesis
MTSFDLLRWRDLTPRDREAWRAFRNGNRALRSPYFDLGWCDAVDRARGRPVRPEGLERGARGGVSALPPAAFQRGAAGGRDLCGLARLRAEPGTALDARAALASGPATLAFSGVPEADPALAPWTQKTGTSHLMDMADGFEAYARPKGRAAPKAIANLRRAGRKLEADGRSLRVVVEDSDRATLDALLRLKSAQYRRSGHADALSWAWSRRLMDVLFELRGDGFRAVLSSLWIDDELAAAHFGLRSGAVLHHWLPAYDPKFAAYAPGNVLAVEIARAAAADGVTEIDLGQGDYPWKKEFANASATAIKGVVHGACLAGRRNAAAWARCSCGRPSRSGGSPTGRSAGSAGPNASSAGSDPGPHPAGAPAQAPQGNSPPPTDASWAKVDRR